MKKIIVGLFVLGYSTIAFAQSETIQKLHGTYEDAFTLFFYKNSFKMFNVEDHKEFEAIVQDIDKMKFLVIDKTKDQFTKSDYKSLVSSYQSESFEAIMSMRQDGLNFNILIKEKDGVTTGLAILIDSDENISVLDIKGAVPLDKIANLTKTIQELRK